MVPPKSFCFLPKSATTQKASRILLNSFYCPERKIAVQGNYRLTSKSITTFQRSNVKGRLVFLYTVHHEILACWKEWIRDQVLPHQKSQKTYSCSYERYDKIVVFCFISYLLVHFNKKHHCKIHFSNNKLRWKIPPLLLYWHFSRYPSC